LNASGSLKQHVSGKKDYKIDLFDDKSTANILRKKLDILAIKIIKTF